MSRLYLFELIGSSLYKKFAHLGAALQHAYPEITWNHDKFNLCAKKSVQRLLKMKIEELLPEVEVIEEFKHDDLSWGNSCEKVLF